MGHLRRDSGGGNLRGDSSAQCTDVLVYAHQRIPEHHDYHRGPRTRITALTKKGDLDGTDHPDDSGGAGHGCGNLGRVLRRKSLDSAHDRATQAAATDGHFPGGDDDRGLSRHDWRRSGVGSLDMELPQAVLVDTADQPIPQQAHDLRVRRFFFLLNEFLNSYKIQLVFAPQTQISCRQRKT